MPAAIQQAVVLVLAVVGLPLLAVRLADVIHMAVWSHCRGDPAACGVSSIADATFGSRPAP